MDCPNCGLTNPPAAERCDCGYDFGNRSGGRPAPPDPSSNLRLGVLVGIAIIIIAVVWIFPSPLSCLEEPAPKQANQASKPPEKSAAQIKEEAKRLEGCRSKLKKLQQLNVLYDLS